jgi:hypothetical protein
MTAFSLTPTSRKESTWSVFAYLDGQSHHPRQRQGEGERSPDQLRLTLPESGSRVVTSRTSLLCSHPPSSLRYADLREGVVTRTVALDDDRLLSDSNIQEGIHLVCLCIP